MCALMLGTLLNAKQAEATCYDHSKQNVNVTKEATCTTTGTREYRCKNCNYLVKSETIPAKGHSWGSWSTVKSATCTENGLKKRTCTRCKNPETQTINKLGHDTLGTPRIVQPTCLADGHTSATCSRCHIETGTPTINKALGHNWGSWTTTKEATCTTAGTKQRKCSRCSKIETSTIAIPGHSYGSWTTTKAATCTVAGSEKRTCTRCGVSETRTTSILGHNMGSWNTVTSPTCTANGLKKSTCSRCGYTETQTINKLGHDTLGTPRIVQPTCLADGHTSATCSRCHIETGTPTVNKALGHNWGSWTIITDATCTANGSKKHSCTRCGYAETQTIEKYGHNTLGTPRIVQATCETDGHTSATCSRCHIETGTPTVNKALGHNWGDWTVTKAADCTTTGTKQRKCTRCSKIETQTIAALGHDTLGTPVIVHETCDKDGYTSATCSRCHIETGTRSINKAKHVWGDWKEIKSATCTAAGTRQRTCKRCSTPETQTIAALGHDTLGTPRIVQATCMNNGYTSATCSRCHIETGTKTIHKALGHDWGKWNTTKSAECTKAGSKQRTCNRCGGTETESIAALGHDTLGTPVIVHETCDKDGYTSATCSRCHIETGDKSFIKAKHIWGDWEKTKDATCTTTGTQRRICKRCSKNETETIAALGHNTLGTPRIVQPTCEDDGYTSAVCSRCYCETGTPTVIKALGHNWSDWGVTKQSKCTETGLKERSCSRCEKRDTQTIEAMGHDTLGTPVIVRATCTTNGYTSATCSRCHIETGKKSVSPASHIWNEWKTEKLPTCTIPGVKRRVCARCKHGEMEDIPALGHNTYGTPRIIQPTCKYPGYVTAVCSRCWCESGEKSIIPATGKHHWGKWETDKKPSCEEKGKQHRVCEVCGEVEREETGPLGHIGGGSTYYSATCEKEGFSGVRCSRCGKNLTGTETAAKGHQWKEWVVDVEPTGDKIGKRHRECSVCKKVEEDSLWGGPDYYVVHFDGNGNKEGSMPDMKFKYGEWFIVPECEFDDGDGFDCWSTTPDGKGRCFKVRYSDEERGIVSDRSITNITLYAIWKTNAVTYHDGVTRAPLGGKAVKEEHIFLPRGTIAFPSLQIDGLLLIGWGQCVDGFIGGEIEYPMGTRSVNRNIMHLYPVYRITDNSKLVAVFDPNGGYDGPGVVLYSKSSQNITVPEKEPKKDGYTFNGWSSSYEGIEDLDERYPGMFKGESIESWNFDDDWARFTAKWVYNARELVLDYGYNGKVETIIVEEEGYKLPKPERLGYEFMGWGTEKDKAIYSGDQEYNPAEGTTTLYAVWKPIKFMVEYYDGFTNSLITTKETDYLDNILGNQCYIDGLEFEGWVEKISKPLNDDDYELKFHSPYASASELSPLFGTAKLYSKYSFKEHDGIMVVYHPNGGSPWIKAEKFAKYSDVTFKDGSSMKKAGFTFSRWINTGTLFWKDDSVFDGSKDIFVIAEWKSNVKLILRYGDEANTEKDISNRFTPGQKIKVSDLVDSELLSQLLLGWKDQKGNYYSVLDEYTIPTENTVLTAVWRESKYNIFYHNGFSGDLYCVPQEVGATGKIYHFPPKEDGYKFEGWVTSLPDELPVGLNPKYKNGAEISLSGDLHLYSCFSEDCQTNPGKITVIYNNKGGEGGPGVVSYNLNPKNPSFVVSEETPERAGYKFLGWSTSYYAVNVDYYPDDTYDEYIPEDGKVTLYAVWGFDHTSDLKAELQRRYGESVMPSTYFDHEFVSPTWRKINDFSYYVIKTTNEVDSDHVKYMTSTVMIVELKNGKWSLESIGLSQKPSEILSYYITTKFDDYTGLAITLCIDAAESLISAAISGVGYILDVCTVNELISELSGHTGLMKQFIEEYAIALRSSIIEEYREQLISAGISEKEADEVIEAQYDYISQECELSAASVANRIFDVTENCMDVLSLTADVETLCKNYGIELDKVLLERGIHVPDSVKSVWKKITKGQRLTVMTTAIGMCIDIGRWLVNSSDLDKLNGKQNRALYAFREELLNQGFTQRAYDEFPDILQKMYNRYYGIAD